jgi:NADH:ubiquinone oxidoreductase subunit 6 (subunit J)
MFDAQFFVFGLMAGFTGLCALATVVTQNIVRSATWLLFTLAGTSGIFFLLGADIVAAIQLLVYVGGTLVLVIFGVMLTAQGPFINMKTSGAEWAISIVAGILLFSLLCFGTHDAYNKKTSQGASPPIDSVVGKYADRIKAQEDPLNSHHSTTIGQALLGAPYGPVYTEILGKPVGTHYLLPFEIVSVHLLVVLIGAAYLARAKRRKGASA